MNINRILLELIEYYRKSRGSGHTTLMKQGISNYEQKKFVLLNKQEDGKTLSIPRDEVVTLNSLERLRGNSLPLAIDNGALMVLLIKTHQYIMKLEQERSQSKAQYLMINKKKEELEKEISYMKSNPFKTLFKTLWQR